MKPRKIDRRINLEASRVLLTSWSFFLFFDKHLPKFEAKRTKVDGFLTLRMRLPEVRNQNDHQAALLIVNVTSQDCAQHDALALKTALVSVYAAKREINS